LKNIPIALFGQKKTDEPIPEPLMSKRYSGKFVVRVPSDLHRELAIEAQELHGLIV
jgi:predicted HicB family RNase H-like nuclease